MASFRSLVPLALLTFAVAAGSGSVLKYPIPNARALGALCNDGTDAMYYSDVQLPAPDGVDYLVYLQGGSYCASVEACEARAVEEPSYVTSSHLPNVLQVCGMPVRAGEFRTSPWAVEASVAGTFRAHHPLVYCVL